MSIQHSPRQKGTIVADSPSKNSPSRPQLDWEPPTPTNVTQRNQKKRMRREGSDKECSPPSGTNSNIMSVINAQSAKLEILMSTMSDVKKQNNDIQKSVQFMSEKYDELLNKFNLLTDERTADRKYIQLLENKIENLDRNFRSTTIEIRNISYVKGESKSDLINIVINAGKVINTAVRNSDIRNIYRVNTQTEGNRPIITEFTNAFTKDDFLSGVKKYNKNNKEKKLNTTILSIAGPEKPVYIAESLTFKAKKLYFLAREFAKQYSYSYCWTSHGLIFLKKEDGARPIRISSELDIEKLRY